MGDPRGRPELREALAEYLARARGVRTSPESIVICAGVRHAVELLTRVFGGPIAVEAYGLFIFRDAIAALGRADDPDRRRRKRRGGRAISTSWTRPPCCSPLPTTTRRACRCTRRGAPPSSTGPSAPAATCSTTTTTASSATTANPSARCRPCVPTGSSTWDRPARACRQTLRLGWMALPDDLVDPVIAAAAASSSTSTPSTS